MARHGHTVLEREALNRNERHHIRCAHTGMRPLMLVQVNQLGCLAHPANRRFLNGFSFARQGEDTAIVVRVHFAVQQVNTVHLHGVDDGINSSPVTAFGKIRNTFHQRRHTAEAYPSGLCTATRS